MSSASETELGAMCITAQEMVAMRHNLQEMKWPHPKSPRQTDNSADAGVVNTTIVPKKSEDNGQTPPLDQMQRSPRLIHILLGKWKP